MASELFKKLIYKERQTVLLPGGNTPKIFFNRLINFNIDWNNISLLASDERIVPLHSNDSNTGMIQRELLDRINNKVKPNLIKLYPINKNQIENKLKLLEEYLYNNCPRIAFLGIGRDGHTAGVFSRTNIENNCYLLKNKMDSFYRITISMNQLINIPVIIFFVLGFEKKESLENILFNKNNKKFVPARYLLKNAIGDKLILCDKKAAPHDFDIGESFIDL